MWEGAEGSAWGAGDGRREDGFHPSKMEDRRWKFGKKPEMLVKGAKVTCGKVPRGSAWGAGDGKLDIVDGGESRGAGDGRREDGFHPS